MTEQNEDELDEITDFNREARYPEYDIEFYETCTESYAKDNFEKIKRNYEWIKEKL